MEAPVSQGSKLNLASPISLGLLRGEPATKTTDRGQYEAIKRRAKVRGQVFTCELAGINSPVPSL